MTGNVKQRLYLMLTPGRLIRVVYFKQSLFDYSLFTRRVLLYSLRFSSSATLYSLGLT